MNNWKDWRELDPKTSKQEVVNQLQVGKWHCLAFDEYLQAPQLHLFVFLISKTDISLFKVVHQINAITLLIFVVVTYFHLWIGRFNKLELLKSFEDKKRLQSDFP